MRVWPGIIAGQHYDFEVDPPEFDLAYDNLKYPKIVLFITRQTQFRNIIWTRIISVGLHWSPIKMVSGFMDIDE